MQPLQQHQGIIATMNRANVDTDAIMPKQYLKSIRKYGYGDWLFDDWRYLDPGDVDIDTSQRRLNPEFELNQPAVAGASILLTQDNFGCGSSREHAVWGLRDFGFRVILSPGFADIFFNNCFNNGILAIVLPQDVINQLFALTEAQPGLPCIVDLQQQTLQCSSLEFSFEIEPARRERLLQGLDAIEVTLGKQEAINRFENHHRQQFPWLFEAL